MIRIAFIAIVSVILIQLTKSVRNEFGLLTKLTAVCLIVFIVYYQFSAIKNTFDFLDINQIESASYIPLIIKTVVAALITEFASAICKDCNENALQTVVELAGKISILIICTPVFQALYSLTIGLLEE